MIDTEVILYTHATILSLDDVRRVGVSATGSGKTLAFLLPAMIHINAQVRTLLCFVVYPHLLPLSRLSSFYSNLDQVSAIP